MDKQNLISKDNSLYNFSISKNGYMTKSNHLNMEILFNAGGLVPISINNKIYEMQKDDIIYIRPNDFYTIDAPNSKMISLTINHYSIKGFDSNLAMNFKCNSVLEPNQSLFYRIKTLFVNFLKTELTHVDDISLQAYSYIYSIVNELVKNFTFSFSQDDSELKYYDRIQRIINYIEANYDKNISLNDLADEFHLSVPYLSSFFSKHLNTNFKDLYDNIKLQHAKALMFSTNLSIEEISYQVGFNSTQTFYRVFKNKEGITPIEYKKQKDVNSNADIESDEILTLLTNYPSSIGEFINKDNLKIEPISFTKPTIKNKKIYQKIIGLGDAKDLLIKSNQDFINELCDNISFEYGFIRNVFSDDLHIIFSRNDKLNYSFSFLDEAIDFVLSKGMKPIIQLGYMPIEIAKKTNRFLAVQGFTPYEPISIEAWIDLLTRFFNHIISYFGTDEVSNWIFTPWRQPDSGPNFFGFTKKEDFFLFYEATYRTLKNINQAFKIGSPEFVPINLESINYMDDFYSYSIKNNCCPDLICFSCYMDKDVNSKFDGTNHNMLTDDEDRFKHVINNVIKLSNKHHLAYQQKFLLAYNLTITHQDELLDTAFMSTFVVKNIIDNIDSIDGIGYWKVSSAEDLVRNSIEFPGKIGLYLKYNIQKPQLMAHIFLKNLLPNIVSFGKGYIITKSNDEKRLVILVYNYEHYSSRYGNGELNNQVKLNRYTAFVNQNELDITIEINDIFKYKHAQISKFLTNRKFGSIYDAWVEMGKPNLDSQDKVVIQLLKGLAQPLYKVYNSKIENNTLTIHEHLSPFEVKTLNVILSKEENNDIER